MCIITVITQIATIPPLIQLLLRINVHYAIILTWGVHQVVGKCYLIILYSISTVVWFGEDFYGLITVTRAVFIVFKESCCVCGEQKTISSKVLFFWGVLITLCNFYMYI